MRQRRRARRSRAFTPTPPIIVALATLTASAHAQGPQLPPPPDRAVANLLADDWSTARSARGELARLGVRALPTLLAARADATPAQRELLDEVARGIILVVRAQLTRPLQLPLPEGAAFGTGGSLGALTANPRAVVWDLPAPDSDPLTDPELGSVTAVEPLDAFDAWRRAANARRAVLALGPAVADAWTAVPPVPQPGELELLEDVWTELYRRERAWIREATPDQWRARYDGIADLAGRLLAVGVGDPDATIRARFAEVVDRAVAEALGALDAAAPAAREAAERAALRLGTPARAPLETLADDARASVHARATARRLARWIRYALSPELVRRVGGDLEDYATKPFVERRSQVIELLRLGGVEAIPTLRALLREDPSEEIQVIAAQALMRLQDPVGVRWLQAKGLELRLARLNQRELASVYMNQGLTDLRLRRFPQAEREFKRVLELEPTSQVAWYNLACTYSLWGRTEQALDHLERAIELGWADVEHMLSDPDLASLRTTERFRELVIRLGGTPPEADSQGDPPTRGSQQ